MKRSKTVFDFVSNNTSESTSVSEAKLEGDLGSLNIESNRILISRNKSTGFQPLGFKKGVYSISELKSFYDGFDDAKWQSFISRLDLGVVRNLGLDSLNRREMTECYNFCISASDPMIIVKRSREMGRMPLLRHLLFDENGDLASGAEEYLADIDSGSSGCEVMRKYFSRLKEGDNLSWATDSFLYRISRASSLMEVSDIGALLSSDLDLTSGESEQRKTYGNRISYIPDIDREYPQFEMMLKVAHNIMNINVGGKKTKTNLFVNIRDQWYRNLIASPQYFVSQPERDYFVTIARDLVLPFYLKADEKMDMTEIYKCLSDKADMVADTLTEKLTLETLRAYVDRWSRNRSVINSQKSEILGDTQKNILEDEWYPIIDDFVTDDGYSFKVLTNRDQLKQEAQKMQSCIGGFSELCLAGNAHVISGTAPDGEFFTMDVRVDRNDIFYLQEVAGFSGKANSCSVTSQEAAKMLVRKMNERSIEVGSEVGKIGEFESMERWLEFDPFNSEHRKAVTALYSEYKLVPSPFMKKGGMTFIKAFVGDSPEFAEEEVDLKFVIPKRKVSDAKKRGDRIELDDNITNPGPTSAFTSIEGVEISKLMESQKDSQEIGGG